MNAIATQITSANTDTIDDAATYDVFYVDNLRTKMMHQAAIASGAQLRQMFARTTDARRIVARRAS